MDGSYVSSVSEFNTEKKDSRKPDERLHAVVWMRRGTGGGKGGEKELTKTDRINHSAAFVPNSRTYLIHVGNPDYVITHMEPTGEMKKFRRPVEKRWSRESHGGKIQGRESIFVHTRKAHTEQIT
jgi:hypothetical protein